MANTNITYNNPYKKFQNQRFKINNDAVRIMAQNPALGIGYTLGYMLGDNYWGKKRNKSAQAAHDSVMNGVSSGDDMDAKNKALDTYMNTASGQGVGADANGVYGVPNTPEGIGANANGVYGIPRTPQQSNTSGVTIGNVNNGGGISSVADAWNQMANNSSYNTGNTTLYTNGARDLSNVMPAGGQVLYQGRNDAPVSIGADANGVYGVPGTGSAPSADNIPRSPQTAAPNPNPTPIPYTPEQLQQIRDYGGFTPEELQRMGAGELNTPPPAESSSGAGGLLGSVVNTAIREQAQPPAAQNPAPTADQMRAIKGDAPAPEVYDYVPGYATPQDMNSGQAYLDDYRRRGSIDMSTLKNALSALVAPFDRSKKRATGR